jgi:serine/threonine-protein kinase
MFGASGEAVDGTPVGRYRLIELIGRGGMGEVWRAHDTGTDRIVAIKVLPAHFSDSEDFKHRFRREAHAAAQLNTPHVIPIHNYGEIDGRLYVDMRLIEGSDLQTVLADGPIEPARAVHIIGQVALALHAAHEVGLLHRDVKPSNILLDRNDFAYLIDFGIARAADETRLTKSGNTIGTFQYIAPERLGTRAEEDARADIYSLACVLYECLTGNPPFDEATLAQLVAAHLNTPPPKPSITALNVPAQIDPVIATGMAKDPDNRYATTVELADAARDAITVPIPRLPPSAAPNPSSTEPASNRATSEPRAVEEESSTTAPSQTPQRAVPSDPSVAVPEHADRTNQPRTQLAPTGPARPPQPAQPTTTGVRRLSRRTRIALTAGAVALVAVIAAAVGISTIGRHHQITATGYGSQLVLPFTGLFNPDGVAVDSSGNVYIVDGILNPRVLKLPVGSATQEALPFTGLSDSISAAVDSAGNLYVADSFNNRVLQLPSGSAIPTVLPFTGLDSAYGVSVGANGSVYVTDYGGKRVLKLPVGSAAQEVLPFTGLASPWGVAVDSTGNVYVTDGFNNRVLKLPAGSAAQEVLPFTGLNFPAGVAVDSAGNLYITDMYNNRALKLPVGSATQEVLPFTGLNDPTGVAVDSGGNLYVTDSTHNRALKLPTQ